VWVSIRRRRPPKASAGGASSGRAELSGRRLTRCRVGRTPPLTSTLPPRNFGAGGHNPGQLQSLHHAPAAHSCMSGARPRRRMKPRAVALSSMPSAMVRPAPTGRPGPIDGGYAHRKAGFVWVGFCVSASLGGEGGVSASFLKGFYTFKKFKYRQRSARCPLLILRLIAWVLCPGEEVIQLDGLP